MAGNPRRLGRRDRLALVVALVVVLVLVGVLLAGAVAAPRERVVHVHASQRFDAPYPLARKAIRDVVHRPAVSVVSVTEIAGRRRLVRFPGWHAYTPAPGDVGVTWRASRWVGERHRSHRLAPRIGYRAPATWAASVLLVHDATRLLVTVAHLPSAVAHRYGWRDNPRRVTAWHRAVDRWAVVVRALERRWRPTAVLVVADWNVPLRWARWRHVLRAEFPRLRVTWRAPLPPRGTARLIDATLTDARGRARLLPRTAASDHRPYSERLYLPRPRA